MKRDYVKWYSPSLHREMEMLVFGHGGFPVLVFPTSYGRFFEYEDRAMIQAVAPKLESGNLQMFCLDSVDLESWYNKQAHPKDRLHRQNAYDAYLTYEVTPFVRQGGWDRMGTTGCSFGGYHALNFALRHPDIVTYAVSMSGAFDIPKRFLNGYYDNDAYLHSPPDYLPALSDPWYFEHYRRNYYVLAAGESDPQLGENHRMAGIMRGKGIPHLLDVWDGFGHDWPWWRRMASKFFL